MTAGSPTPRLRLLRQRLRWLVALFQPAPATSARTGQGPLPLSFDAETIADMVRAAGVACAVLHHRDGTATIAAGEINPDRAYPLLCRLGRKTTPRHGGDFEIRPGRSTNNDTPQDILVVGCTTNRDVADLILAYIAELATRPPGSLWELLGYDRLEHLGFDGTARGSSRGRTDLSSSAVPSTTVIGAVGRARLRYRLWRSRQFRF